MRKPLTECTRIARRVGGTLAAAAVSKMDNAAGHCRSRSLAILQTARVQRAVGKPDERETDGAATVRVCGGAY